MTPIEYLKNKKVLVMGLGLLGGGIATTKWLVKHGAKVTVTDLKTKKELAASIKALWPTTSKIGMTLGRHLDSDFRSHQIIVVNPAVPKESRFLKIARQAGAKLENEASLFFRFCKNPIIGVTGTRGKTTTTNWIHYFLKQKFKKTALTGNSAENTMLKALDELDDATPIVVELSSWHLELLFQSNRGPHIAIITNLYPDHLNRYKDMKEYALAKANIFKNQTRADFLILNKKNDWTKLFLKQKPASQILFSDNIEKYLAERILGKGQNPRDKGLTVRARQDIFQTKNFAKNFGEHNLENLKTAALAANAAGVGWNLIKKALPTLPQIKFREEIVYQNSQLTVINDTTATSSDATIAALNRFSNQGLTLILITGGTDKNLDFANWAKAVKKFVDEENLFLLDGSATVKMLAELNKIKYFKKEPRLFRQLDELLRSTLKSARISKQKTTVLFSPAAASFEKFKNEFDRGEQFNKLLKKEEFNELFR